MQRRDCYWSHGAPAHLRAPIEAVRIGELDAISGPFAAYGWMNRQDIQLDVETISRAGGFEVGCGTSRWN